MFLVAGIIDRDRLFFKVHGQWWRVQRVEGFSSARTLRTVEKQQSCADDRGRFCDGGVTHRWMVDPGDRDHLQIIPEGHQERSLAGRIAEKREE